MMMPTDPIITDTELFELEDEEARLEQAVRAEKDRIARQCRKAATLARIQALQRQLGRYRTETP